jgi:signal transduction histidine kinase/DNA-binding response OmpR family regulator
MTLIQKLDGWLIKMLWHKSDTPETLEQKVYLARNGLIASFLISLIFTSFLFFGLYKLLLVVSPTLAYIILMLVLLILVKQRVKWFLYIYYGGFIIICSLVILELGGLPNSLGIWGGSFIVFMHTLALKDKKILMLNAFLYVIGLVVIAFLFPYLSPPKEWTPRFNNLGFTMNEFWMCLFLVKSFSDSIVIRTNEAKRRSAHLQELDLLKSKLYANITHEFRTPLTLIRGNAEEIGSCHDGETTERVSSIIQSSDKILFLVNQMLNLSKIEEGSVPMHYVQSDLVAFMRFIVGSFQGYADVRKIRLHFEPQCKQLIMDIEAEKLEESVSNLLSNAIKYTPEGGDVFVNLRLPNPGKTTEQQVEISVRDTGIGIPEDQLDKIFIRFYRVEDQRYPYREGTGIGLTLVNEYLKLMKGSIQVKSAPGKGSEFVISLPVTNKAAIEENVLVKGKFMQREEPDALKSITTGYFSGQPRLLIIEDNHELLEYLVRLLGNDYQILTAENGIQGIEQATEYIPDIILSDVMMPVKDGYQLCKELKNDFRTSHIPIILLTARADTESRITGLELGADAYLTKPFNKKELTICLHNLLIQRETLRLKFSADNFNKKVDGKEAGLNGKFLDQVMMYLEKNYKNDMYGIQTLYSDMGISRVQLHRKLTALTGQSASNFIRSFRLQKAKRLLLETDKNVSDIAFEVGIADAKYFSKSFILEFGLTATELRKSFR